MIFPITTFKNLRAKIKSNKWIKEQRKTNPLQYSFILNESTESYGSIFGYFPIDDHMYIESFITSNGIQSCGLYFKVKRCEDPDDLLGGGKVLDLCRISMTEPKYIIGFDETFSLKEKQKENLVNQLKSKMGSEDITLWEYLFESMNSGRDPKRCKDCNLQVLPMPNYLLL